MVESREAWTEQDKEGQKFILWTPRHLGVSRSLPTLNPQRLSKISPPKAPYRPELGSLRAIAIAVVMMHHYLKGHHFVLGGFGVVLFFVLSGYFGTRGLLGIQASMAR